MLLICIHVGPKRESILHFDYTHHHSFTFSQMSAHTHTHTRFPTYANLLPNPLAPQGKSSDHFAILLTPPSNTCLLVLCTDRKNMHSSMIHWFVLDQLGVALCVCVCVCVLCVCVWYVCVCVVCVCVTYCPATRNQPLTMRMLYAQPFDLPSSH